MSELEAERDFLVARMETPDSDWVGRSSTAMVVQALKGDSNPSAWPLDESDLARCEQTYLRAPEHLQRAMLPTLERFRRHIAQRYSAA